MRVASRCGRWVWLLGGALNDMISGQCVPLPCFHTFFQLHHDNQQPYITHLIFFSKIFFVCYIYMLRTDLKPGRFENHADGFKTSPTVY